jgi:hypothetical protein
MASNNIFISIGGFLGGLTIRSSGGSGNGGAKDSGVRKSEKRPSGSFDRIRSLISGDVSVRYGDADEIVVEADENIVPLIKTDIDGDVLTVSSSGSFSTSQPIKVSVTIPKDREMPDLDLIGSGDISMHGIDQADISVNLQGSGDISLSGTAGRIRLSLMGSGDIDARRLKGKEVDISLMGSGDIEASASEKVSVTLMGSGDVVVSGSPKKISSSNLGSGDVSIR